MVNSARITTRYRIREEKKIMGFCYQEAGIYEEKSCGFEHVSSYIGDKVPENYFVKEGNIYEKSEVVLHYQCDHNKTYYFDTYEEAKKFTRKLTSIGNFIE